MNGYYTIDVFDSLRLDGTTWDANAVDYVRNAQTESVYLAGIAHVVYDPSLPSRDDPEFATTGQHVFYETADQVGSTSTVFDRNTGELVERISNQAYGATDSDYRPDRWNHFREARRLSGHTDDVELGLVYFGARYYSPNLQQWISADPLTIHGLGSSFNPYAYVNGHPAQAVDLYGLEEDPYWLPDPVSLGGGGGGGGGGGSNGTSATTSGNTGCGQYYCTGGGGGGGVFVPPPPPPPPPGTPVSASPAQDASTFLTELKNRPRDPDEQPFLFQRNAPLFVALASLGVGLSAELAAVDLTALAASAGNGARTIYATGMVFASAGGTQIVTALNDGSSGSAGSEMSLLEREAAAGATHLMAASDPFLINASKAAPLDDYYDVVAHGNAHSVVDEFGNELSHNQLANRIWGNGDYKAGQPIRLISCETGACDVGFAQRLATKMQVNVLAADKLVIADPDGTLTVSDAFGNPGKWIVFEPLW